MRLNSVVVKEKQKVKKGQVIGVMGNTGNCVSSNTAIPPEYRGTHLHLGIKENSTAWNNGSWVNPIPYLAGAKIIKPNQTTIITPSNPTPQPPSATIEFRVNDKVRIKSSAARYASGTIMPNRVKFIPDRKDGLPNLTHTIMQIGRERVLLEEIMSWVNDQDIIKI